MKTISHAILLLGLARIRSITVTRALGDFVAPVLNVSALRVCWKNSLAGALIAKKLGRACNMDSNFAYLAGLVRDILFTISGEQGCDLRTTERKLFDVDHCQAGAWLIERMPLPPELIEVAAHHHEVPHAEAFGMVHLVRIADRMTDTLGFGVGEPSLPLEFADVLQELPEPARSCFVYDAAELRLEVEASIRTWH